MTAQAILLDPIEKQLELARIASKTDLKKSFSLARLAKKKAESAGYTKGIADAYRIIGNNYSAQNKLPAAVDFYNKALELYQKEGDTKGISMIYNNLGIANFKMFKYTEAINFYFKSLKLKEEAKDKKGTLSTLINIGAIYQRQANYDEAIRFYQRAAATAEKLNDTTSLAASLQNMGETLIEQKKYRQALKALSKAADIFIKSKNYIDLVSTYINMGIVYRSLGKLGDELKMYEAGKAIAEKQKLQQELGVCLQNTGEALLKARKYGPALEHLQKAVTLLEKTGSHPSRTMAYKLLAKLYRMRKDYKRSLLNQEKYATEIFDIYNKDRGHQINEIHMRYEVEKREKEAEIFRLKNVELKNALKSLDAEKKRSDSLLKNILPAEVAEDLKTKGRSDVRYFENVTVMFIDIKNFTQHTEKTEPAKLVEKLGLYFTAFEKIIAAYKIEKIKTIGDAFLCACGLPVPDKKHAEKMVKAASEIIAFADGQKQQLGSNVFEVRIGIHSGPVIAGIIGTQKFAYDIWGDTVNTAARMEQSGEAGKINISHSTYNLVKKKVSCLYRGKLPAKNKGEIDMYFVETIC